MRTGKVRQQKKTTQTGRRRRSTEEIKDRIMEAAGEEFERNGYAGTTTAAIARKARVGEALIFSNFGSKAKLFHDSVFNPLDRHFQDFCATHVVDADDTNGRRKEARQYILELQEFVQRHSEMLKSLVAAQMYTSDDVAGLSQFQGLHDYFARAAAKAMTRLEGTPIDPKLLARISFATVLACVIFKDWLFPKWLATKHEIGAAIADFIMDGINADIDLKANGGQRSESTKSR